jgi:PAS domain S-box-containing protein
MKRQPRRPFPLDLLGTEKLFEIPMSEPMMPLPGLAFAMREPDAHAFAKSTIFDVEPRSAKAVLVAVGCTVVAWVVRWAIGYAGPGVSPFPVFLASTLVAAAWAGIPAGATAAALGFLLSWLVFSSASPGTFSLAGITLYTFSAAAVIGVAERYRALVRRLEAKETVFSRQLSLIQEENDALAQIASDVSLPQTLGKLTQTIERYCEARTVASVMLLDPKSGRLRIGAAPRLPETFSAAIDGKQIGPAAGSCGTAAYRKLPVYVTDIETDPLWVDYRHAALQHGLVSCWSVPIMSKGETVLGTFAVYHREKREAKEEDKQIVSLLTRIAAIAIERENDKMQRLRGEEVAQRLAAIVQSSEDAIVGKDLNGIITTWNGSAERLFGFTAEEAIGNPITILIPEDRLQEEADIMRRLRSGQHVEHFETVRRRKDGTPIEISVAVSPIKTSTGVHRRLQDGTRHHGTQAARRTDHRACPGGGAPVKESAGNGAGNHPAHSGRHARRFEGGHRRPDSGAGSRPRALRGNEMGGGGPARSGRAGAFALLPGR